MSAAAAETTAQLEPPATQPDSADGLGAAGAGLLAALKDQARHVAELAAAETRLALLSGAAILGMALLAAAALLMTWGLIAVLAVDGLRRLGLSWQLAVAVLALAHLLAAWGLWRGAVRLSANLALPRLRHTLLGGEHDAARSAPQ